MVWTDLLTDRSTHPMVRFCCSPSGARLHGAFSPVKTREWSQNGAALQLPSDIKRRSAKIELGDSRLVSGYIDRYSKQQ